MSCARLVEPCPARSWPARNVKLVECDFRVRKKLPHPRDAGRAHIDACPNDQAGVAAVGDRIPNELSNRRLVATGAGENHTAGVVIPDRRDAFVPLARRGLVDPDATPPTPSPPDASRHRRNVQDTSANDRRLSRTGPPPSRGSVDAHRHHELFQPTGQAAPRRARGTNAKRSAPQWPHRMRGT